MSDYIHNQTVKYLSHEDDNARWRNGQIRFINHFLLPVLDKMQSESLSLPVRVLDAGCGDGAGLSYLHDLGFRHALGLDLSTEKLQRARLAGQLVANADLHDLSRIPDALFDVVYASHSLEHCYNPSQVVSEFKRVARPDAVFVLVLPFPDRGPYDAHCGSKIIGSTENDGAASVLRWLSEQGLTAESLRFDSFREPELWLELRRIK